MSTKKDKFSQKDKRYMKIALNLAKSKHGLTGSNPSVGCIIVKNDKIISLGTTSFNGRPHAEFNAIKNSFEELGQSEISTNTIGTMVMEGLKELDPVAYVRFASVYRNFREEKDFVQFVDKLDVYKKR